jgi:transketolase N-terminal domain/subunit
MDKKRVTELSIIANNVRKHALTAVYSAASGHPGGSLSVADVLTLLYFEVMNVDPKNPKRVTQHLHYTVYLQKKDLYQKRILRHSEM